jgi:hypothetical protein
MEISARKWFVIPAVSLLIASCGSSGSDEPQFPLPELEGNTR